MNDCDKLILRIRKSKVRHKVIRELLGLNGQKFSKRLHGRIKWQPFELELIDDLLKQKEQEKELQDGTTIN